jgi:small subunit ribosomal protein S16
VAVKIKLKRLGKIRAPYYRIVVADARTKRDGRAIEEIGKYHPKAEPSFIEVDSERAQHWLSVGAQPTDPVRKILEITGDWQKFKGLPGTEGTLRVAAPKEDRKEIYAAAMQETVSGGLATTPKGRAAKAKSGDAEKAGPAAKADTAKADTAKADTAKADTAKADTAKADTAKADAKDPAAAKADKPVKADKPAKQAEPEEAPAAAASADAPAAEAAGSEPGSGA